MPRGVPASGKRQPRAVSAVQYAAETPVAGGTMDVEDRDYSSAQEEAPAPAVPADGVSVAEKVEMIAGEPAELSPEQKQIAELKDQLARLAGRKDVEPEPDDLVNPGDERNIVIHFLEDGLTALGKVWFRGQELEFEVGSQAYMDTFDRLGRSWLELRNDEFGQVERFGKIMFRNGPWPGKSYADGAFESLKELKGAGSVPAPTPEELEAADKARLRRAAPRLPSLTSNIN